MSVRLLLIGEEKHWRKSQLRRDRAAWVGSCSCGQMATVTGGASAVAERWHEHVAVRAAALGVTPTPPAPRGPRTAQERKQRWWNERQARERESRRPPQVGDDGREVER